MKELLVANRGEIAIRIARAAHDLGIGCVAVYSADDARSLHMLRADEAIALNGTGPAAYLDMEQLIGAARQAGCDALHPGYEFLSESAAFARRVAAQGLIFVGPAPGVLDIFGDKGAARALATKCGVPVLHGTSGETTLQEARAVFDRCANGIMIKAIAGGGGRGIRKVTDGAELGGAMDVCRAEARAAFGIDGVYVDELITHARHIEVQVLADATGDVTVLGARECSLQRRHQKVVEIAPVPRLDAGIRAAMADAARSIAIAASLQGLGTFEFLVLGEGRAAGWLFLECNPRLQVEHTVTEAIFGLDLVQAQLQVAAGRSLAELGLQQSQIPPPNGYAIELRINMERAVGGGVQPASGTLTAFEPPSGPGIRVDTHGYPGFTPSPLFDSLLAKLVVHAARADFLVVLGRAARALSEFRIEGVPTNKALLQC
jgi:acetyl/propionyl-CoA carboxylase alpha subunit